MSETRRRSTARFLKRNQLETSKKRPRPFISTPLGHKMVTDKLLTSFADFLARKLDVQPDKPPRFLSKLVRELDDTRVLALAALAPLLDGIFRGWKRDDPSWEAKLKLGIGDDLYERLYREPKIAAASSSDEPGEPRIPVTILLPWTSAQRLRAGHWLLQQALRLDFFAQDDDGFFCISDGSLPYVAELREQMIAADPSYAPLLKPAPPWNGYWKTYHDGFRVKFVRDWRPETKKAIDVAFLNPLWDHAAGVNALAAVPLKIDTTMVALVERFAVEIMGNEGAQRLADEATVRFDVADAKWCGDRAIWTDYSCDRRGRVYALQHLNFGRADHVRSMFRFANGAAIDGDTKWLEIHCANCWGANKESRDDRIKWVKRHKRDITEIARDPVGTFDKRVLGGQGWREADKPFAFVAACRELVAAWDDPKNFITHLPIGFDGSANGLQHLALLVGDAVAAEMVNLLPVGDTPNDVYALIIAKAIQLIRADPCDDARFWREQFEDLTDRQQRKLLKPPIMTYAYSVTDYGATDQIVGVYKSFRRNVRAEIGAFRYLAKKVRQACEQELSGPADVMDYICKVADYCTDENRFMEWTSPSDFPVSNRYQKPNIKTIKCTSGGVRVEHDIADGVTDEIRRKKTANSAAPNFIHSLDAAHLIKVVNAAVSEGILDLLTVHDCYACLAPQASRLHQIILDQLADLYGNNCPLTALRRRNVSAPDLPVPPKGLIFTWAHGKDRGWRMAFSPERVRGAKNAFG